MEGELEQASTNSTAHAAAWRLRNCEISVSDNGDGGSMSVSGSTEGVKRADWATSLSVIIGVDE